MRLVLGDQLTPSISSLADIDRARDVVLMAEVTAEASYVPHHPKKIASVFAAMRHFAAELLDRGIRVDYVRLDDDGNSQCLEGELARALVRHGAERAVVCEPGEWRLDRAMRGWSDRLAVPIEIRDDDRFFCTRREFADFSKRYRRLRMESFYRHMRRRTGLLVDGHDQPVGGRWNYDRDNRRPAMADARFPELPSFEPDAIAREVLDLVAKRFLDRFGDLLPFGFAVTRADAERAFEHFVAHGLPAFGDDQDAMLHDEDVLHHAAISHYLNVGLLDARAVCRRVEQAHANGHVPINAAEGFIRQILGWREFVRGIYWLHMPGYAEMNHLQATRDLPAFYWTGATDMRCLAKVVDQTRRSAYSHHIQRLMVTGNFALLAGVRPEHVHLWYLSVYADAYEWVEMPNTLGMALFADGGLTASKPYAASGNYIRRMSDFCRGCAYDVRKRTGDDACPFNYLYWDFMIRNRERLARNPRLGPIFRQLARMDQGDLKAMRVQAARFLDRLPSWRPQEHG